MVRCIHTFAGLALLTLPVAAQSINVDFGPENSPFGLPPTGYGASNQKPGVWNSVGTMQATNLLRWDGIPTGVTLTNLKSESDCPIGVFFSAGDRPETSGNDAAILDDESVNSRYGPRWKFEGLANGPYVVDTIAMRARCGVATNVVVFVLNSLENGQTCSGLWNGQYVQGDSSSNPPPYSNFTRHHVTVTDGTLVVIGHTGNVFFNETSILCAIQLDAGEREPTGTPFCFPGQGTVMACPCGNPPASPTVGCDNFGPNPPGGTGGAELACSGIASTGMDTLRFQVTEEILNTSNVSVLWQGTTTLPIGAQSGAGVRCVGGTLRRLYKGNAFSGAIDFPSATQPDVHTASAAKGFPIVPPVTLHYYVSYRNSAAGVPCGDATLGFNTTNAMSVPWQP